MKASNQHMDQMIVRIWRACNFKCWFCNVSDNEKHVQLRESIYDIIRNFHYKMKYSNLSSKDLLVTISWGEPSLFKTETIFAIKYVDRFLRKRGITPHFDIQTNASLVTSEFAKQIFSLWVRTALVSCHTNDRSIFNETIGVDYDVNFPKILQGMQVLHDAGIAVDVNVILYAQNASNFLENISYLEREIPYIRTFNMGFLQPHGEADKNLANFLVDYPMVAPIYNRAVAFLNHKKRPVLLHFVGLPACHLLQPSFSMEVRWNAYFRSEYQIGSSGRYLINNINDANKGHTRDCDLCAYNNVCSGIWHEYHGVQRLRPLRWYRSFEGLSFWKSEQHIIVAPGTPIRAIRRWFDGNKRFAYVRSCGYPIGIIIQTIRDITACGFYKTCLIWDDERNISMELLDSGVGNIQVDASCISPDQLEDICEFSRANTPQFRIDVDIVVSRHDSMVLLHRCGKLLQEPFVRVFILRDPKISLDDQRVAAVKTLQSSPVGNIHTVGFSPATSTLLLWK